MNGITPEFLEDTQMRLEEGTDPELIIKALSIGATNAHGSAVQNVGMQSGYSKAGRQKV